MNQRVPTSSGMCQDLCQAQDLRNKWPLRPKNPLKRRMSQRPTGIAAATELGARNRKRL